MPRTRAATAAGLALVLGAGLLAGCRSGDASEPAEPTEPTTTATVTAEPEPTDEPSAEATAGSAVNGPNSITAPPSGGTVAGPNVTVEGEGTGFEGTLLYRVTRAGSTDVVTEGVTTAGANGEVGPYTAELELEPGEYTVQVWEPGMGEGDTDGDPRNLVEATFTVT